MTEKIFRVIAAILVECLLNAPTARSHPPAAQVLPTGDYHDKHFSVEWIDSRIGYECITVDATHQGPKNYSYGNDKTCFQNMQWARGIGLTQMPQCYTKFGIKDRINATSPNGDVQYLLWSYQTHHHPGDPLANCTGWGCPLPCGKYVRKAIAEFGEPALKKWEVWRATMAPTFMATPPPIAMKLSTPTTAPTMAPPAWQNGRLIALLACVVLVAICGIVACIVNKKKPTKRSIGHKSSYEPMAAPTTYAKPPPPAPVTTTYAAPVPVTTTYAAPMTYAVQAPMMYAAPPAPVTTAYAAPVTTSYAAPASMTYAAPMTYAVQAAPTTYEPASLFDQLDTNGDGQLDRTELARMGLPSY
jgi:hypothetical protein